MSRDPNIMLVPEAAEKIGIGQELLRAWLRRDTKPCPFGTYICEPGNKQGRYLIFRNRLEAYLNSKDMLVTIIRNEGLSTEVQIEI